MHQHHGPFATDPPAGAILLRGPSVGVVCVVGLVVGVSAMDRSFSAQGLAAGCAAEFFAAGQCDTGDGFVGGRFRDSAKQGMGWDRGLERGDCRMVSDVVLHCG